MKIRTGFVSNSSSSCFICNTNFSVEEVTVRLSHIIREYYNIAGYPVPLLDQIATVTIADETNQEFLEEWSEWYPELKNIKDGDILIRSVGDNSIPYDTFNKIESTFHAYKFHLG